MLKHIAVAFLQAIVPVVLVLVAVALWLIREHGWAYVESDAFHQVMSMDFRYAVAATVLLLLVIICYRVTRRTLDT